MVNWGNAIIGTGSRVLGIFTASLTLLLMVSRAAPPDAQQRLVFYSTRDGNGEVYMMDIMRLFSHNLTADTAWDAEPAWSPDRTQVAFVSLRNNNLDIYVTGAGCASLLGRCSVGLRRLTDHSARDKHPVWSPDGSQIAFMSDREGNWDIYLMDADGNNVRRLTDHPAEDGRPAWSPDGTRIAFETNRDGNFEIYVVNTDGSNLRRLTDSRFTDLMPSWSPDGRRIAFATSRHRRGYEIYVMDADGSNPTRLTNNTVWDAYPVWSPDGQRITFESWRDGNLEIYIMDADGSNVRRLTYHEARDGNPS